MKINSQHLKTFVIVLLIVTVISFILAGVSAFIGGMFHKPEQASINTEKTFTAEDVKKINIKTISANIKLEESTDGMIRATLRGQASSEAGIKLDARMSGNTLHIIVRRRRFMFQFFSFHKNLALEVSIPKDYSNNLIVSSTSGNITLLQSNARNITLDTTSGDITAENCSPEKIKIESVSGELLGEKILAGEMKLNTTSGEITMKQVTGRLTCDSVSGDVYISYAEFDSPVMAETVSGNIELYLGSEPPVKVDFSTVSGDFSSDLSLVINERKRNKVKGGSDKNGIEISVETVSGDFYLKK